MRIYLHKKKRRPYVKTEKIISTQDFSTYEYDEQILRYMGVFFSINK